MKQEIDCRKMDCPAPVLKAKEALEAQALTRIRVLVDNDAAVENVSRFLNFHGFEVAVDATPTFLAVEGTKDSQDAARLVAANPDPGPREAAARTAGQKIMVMVASDRMGSGDDDLGEKLMINFLKTLKEMGEDLWRLVFVNHGVKLATQGAAALPILKELESVSVDILVCGACLTHLGLLEKKAAGQTTNMLDIVTSMQVADKVINI